VSYTPISVGLKSQQAVSNFLAIPAPRGNRHSLLLGERQKSIRWPQNSRGAQFNLYISGLWLTTLLIYDWH